MKTDLKHNKVDQFLNFMVDCKVQEALARNEGKTEDADYIRQWFVGFRNILRQIFDDTNLELDFNYKDYSFLIQTRGKSFKFTELSAGYSAALDIVADSDDWIINGTNGSFLRISANSLIPARPSFSPRSTFGKRTSVITPNILF